MYVPLINYFIDVEEAIVVLCVVIIAYMGVMHLEFRQLKLISKRFGEEDDDFTKSIRELRSDLNSLGDIVKDLELKTISNHVDGSGPVARKKSVFHPKSSSDTTDAKTPVDAADSTPKSSPGDSKSLKDMLDKV